MKLLFIPSIILGIVVIVNAIFPTKLRFNVNTVLFPLILMVNIVLNLYSFQHINHSGRWHLQCLPSNEFIDLIESSLASFRTPWIYPLIEEYYMGRILLSSSSVLETLNLSSELLQSQGRLADVKMLDHHDISISGQEVQMILLLEHVDVVMENGTKYIFVTEKLDSKSPILIIKYEEQVFFVPIELLPDKGVNP